MPAAEQSRTNAARRTSRHLPSEDEIEIRRARGEISCAECKRLKLKCDRNVPCGSCVRRGYSSLCPNGSLTTGGSSKANGESESQMTLMAQRIRILEEALADLQSTVSSDPHPLLVPDNSNTVPSTTSLAETIAGTTAAFGTLAVGEHGNSLYYGSSAGTESLILVGAELAGNKMTQTDPVEETEALDAEMKDFAQGYVPTVFFGTDGIDPDSPKYSHSLDFLLRKLPDRLRASALCEAYEEHFSWMFRPQTRQETIDFLITPIYSETEKHFADPEYEGWKTNIPTAKLAALFGLFAIGALGDLTLPPHGFEAERYNRFAKAAMSLKKVMFMPSIDAILSLLLLAHYQSNAGKRYTLDSTWTLIQIASKMGQSIGLHRDCVNWDMDNREMNRRRRLWWEMYCGDVLASLSLGRPPSIEAHYMDCPFPTDDLEYFTLKYTLVKNVFSQVMRVTLNAIPPTYDKVLELDKLVRDFKIPAALSTPTEDPDAGPGKYMRAHILEALRGLSSLYIHRSYFARALLDSPINPLKSPFALSFLAVYRLSSWTIKTNQEVFNYVPDLTLRWWPFWQGLFNSAIVVGSIVTRSPSSAVSATAFVELGIAVDLFEKGAAATRRARGGIVVLRKLRLKAQHVYYEYHSKGIVPTVVPNGHPTDELSLFGGQTKMIVSPRYRQKTANTLTNAHSPSSSVILTPGNTDGSTSSSANSPRSPPQQNQQIQQQMQSPNSNAPLGAIPEVHPSLEQFMGFFPASAYAPGFDINGNSTAPETGAPLAPQMPSELQDYNFPPMSFNPQASNWALPGGNPIMNGSGMAHYSETSSIPTYGEFGGFEDLLGAPPTTAKTPETPSDDFITDLLPSNGAAPNDQQWWSFLAQTGIPHIKT